LTTLEMRSKQTSLVVAVVGSRQPGRTNSHTRYESLVRCVSNVRHERCEMFVRQVISLLIADL